LSIVFSIPQHILTVASFAGGSLEGRVSVIVNLKGRIVVHLHTNILFKLSQRHLQQPHIHYLLLREVLSLHRFLFLPLY
jgi:hypothetical protein